MHGRVSHLWVLGGCQRVSGKHARPSSPCRGGTGRPSCTDHGETVHDAEVLTLGEGKFLQGSNDCSKRLECQWDLDQYSSEASKFSPSVLKYVSDTFLFLRSKESV